jgi:uncharacterized protein YuzE
MLKEGITIDTEYKLAYVYLAAGEVARTEVVHQGINIDINKDGRIFGIEFLNIDSLPYSPNIELECESEFREVFISAILLAQGKVLLAKAK